MSDLRAEMKRLADELREHRYRYYVLDQPTISDVEYDLLERKLRDLEAAHPDLADPNSPTMRVGASPVDTFEKAQHEIPMLSLKNAYIPDSLREVGDHADWADANIWPDGWDAQIRSWADSLIEALNKIGWFSNNQDIRYSAELKVDGLSLALRYQHRKLAMAVTRGDGEIGEVVTENAQTIADIPIELPSWAPTQLEVRGEVFLSRKRWEELNTQLDSEGQVRFANPRNAASGTLKLLDSREVARRRLSFLPWQVLGSENHEASMVEITDWGFGRMPRTTNGDLDAILAFIRQQAIDRLLLPFDTDGVVIKVQLREIQDILGATDHHPRWAIAFKFPALQVTTTVQQVTWQVGRTGKLTPVAELDPVDIAGSIVRRATLHNPDEMNRLGLRIGQRVFVEKGGDVIPKVVAVVPGEEAKLLTLPEFPSSCPACNGAIRGTRRIRKNKFSSLGRRRLLGFKENLWSQIGLLLKKLIVIFINKVEKPKRLRRTVGIRCINPECPSRLEGRFIHFANRNALDIEGMGAAVSIQLANSGRFKHPWEILELLDKPLFSLDFLRSLEGFAEVSADSLFHAIEGASSKPLWRWIHALGIQNVGEGLSKSLALAFPSFDALWSADEWSLIAVRDVGVKVANSLRQFVSDHPNIPKDLYRWGVRPVADGGLAEGTGLENWLLLLPITDLGRVKVESLLDIYPSVDTIWGCKKEDLTRLPKWSTKKGHSKAADLLYAFIREHPALPESLHHVRLVREKEAVVFDRAKPLAGQSIVLTGTLPTLSRLQASGLLVGLGAKVTDSVSKSTAYVIAGGEAGFSKLSKAEKLGIPIRDEAWLLELMDGVENE